MSFIKKMRNNPKIIYIFCLKCIVDFKEKGKKHNIYDFVNYLGFLNYIYQILAGNLIINYDEKSRNAINSKWVTSPSFKYIFYQIT